MRNSIKTTIALLFSLALVPALPAAAQYTIGFENLSTPPGSSSASSSFSNANGGSDVVNGVTFDDNFIVFGKNYVDTGAMAGTDVYGSPNGTYAITNGDGSGGTGPYPAGSDGLIITTNDTLQSAYFGQNDYGDGSYGADQVTVTAFGSGGDLSSASVNLTSTTLTLLDTSGTFNPYAGSITGYRINYEFSPDYAALNSVGFDQSGGNYVADDFTFKGAPTVTGVPEMSPVDTVSALLLGLGVMSLVSLRRRSRA